MSKRFDSLLRKRFRSSKCKTLLKLTVSRIKLLKNKRDAVVKQARRDVAQLLQSGQETNARIRVENVYREQNAIIAYDLIEQFCDTIVNRLPIIEAQKLCPADLKGPISSLIFAAPHCSDLEELQQLRDLFAAKYGKQFVAAAAELRPDCGVNRQIIEKLSSNAPAWEVKLKLIKEIAAEHKIDWDPEKAQAELTKVPEDLLDGHTCFFSASQASIVDAIPNNDSISESPKTSVSAESHPSTTDETSSSSSSPHYSHGDKDVRPAQGKSFPDGKNDLLPLDVSKKGGRHQSQLLANLSSVSEDISEADGYTIAKTGGQMDYKGILEEDRRGCDDATALKVESEGLPFKLEKCISSLDSHHSETGVVFTRGKKYKYRDVACAAQEAFESAALAAAAAHEVVKLAKRESRNGANNGTALINSSDGEEVLDRVRGTDTEKITRDAGNRSELIDQKQKHIDDIGDISHGSEDDMDYHPQFSHSLGNWHSYLTVERPVERSPNNNMEVKQILSSKGEHRDASSFCTSIGTTPTTPKEHTDPNACTVPSFDEDDNHDVAQASLYTWNHEGTSSPSSSFELSKDQSNPHASTGPIFDDIGDNAIDDATVLSTSTHSVQGDHFKFTDRFSDRAEVQSIAFSQDEISLVGKGYLNNISDLGDRRKSRSKADLSTIEEAGDDREALDRHFQLPDFDNELAEDHYNRYASAGPIFDDNIGDNAIDDGIMHSTSTPAVQGDHSKFVDRFSNRSEKQSISFSQDEISSGGEGCLDNISELGYVKESKAKAGLSTTEKTELDREPLEGHFQLPDFDKYLEPNVMAEKTDSAKAPLEFSNQTGESPVKAAQTSHRGNNLGLKISPDKESAYGFETPRKLKWHSRSQEESNSSSQFSGATPQVGYDGEIATNATTLHYTTTTNAILEHGGADFTPLVKGKSYHGDSRRSVRSVRSQQNRGHTRSRQQGDASSKQMPPSTIKSVVENDMEFM